MKSSKKKTGRIDEIREVAAEFCMDAEDILGYVLEYRFDVEKEQAVNAEN